jgi:hypothetical protein
MGGYAESSNDMHEAPAPRGWEGTLQRKTSGMKELAAPEGSRARESAAVKARPPEQTTYCLWRDAVMLIPQVRPSRVKSNEMTEVERFIHSFLSLGVFCPLILATYHTARGRSVRVQNPHSACLGKSSRAGDTWVWRIDGRVSLVSSGARAAVGLRGGVQGRVQCIDCSAGPGGMFCPDMSDLRSVGLDTAGSERDVCRAVGAGMLCRG